MSNHSRFGNIVLLLIVISTVGLAVQTPLDDPESDKVAFLTYMDHVMTGLFVCEMMTHIIARGFIMCGPKSYIRDPANVLDFVIVASAVFSVVFSGIEIGFLKSLRVLRVLRPLRIIARNKGLKLALSALINSLPSIANLLLIVMFFLFMLAILCTTLFSGQFYYCETEHLGLDDFIIRDGIVNRYDCLMYGGEWVNPDF